MTTSSKMFADEHEPLYKMRKKLKTAQGVALGHVFTHEDLAIKAPGDGLAPYHLDEVIGKRTTWELTVDEDIRLEGLRN